VKLPLNSLCSPCFFKQLKLIPGFFFGFLRNIWPYPLSASALCRILLTGLLLPVFFVFLFFPKWELVLYQMMFNTMELFVCLFSNWAQLFNIIYTIATVLESCQIAPTLVSWWFHQAYNNSSPSPGFVLALVLSASALACPNLLGTNDCTLDKQLSLAFFLGILRFGSDLYLKYLGTHFLVTFLVWFFSLIVNL